MSWTAHASAPSRRPLPPNAFGVPTPAQLGGRCSVVEIWVRSCVQRETIPFAKTSAAREGRITPHIFQSVGLGLVKNPMIVSIVAGLTVSALKLPLPGVVTEFVTMLGNAATPCALFAIGASLASKSAERIAVSGWLSFAKLVLHPLFVAGGVFLFFPVEPFQATVAVSTAAMPVAGNVFMLAQHYGIAPQRVSAAILISTAASILTVSAVIGLVAP